MCTSRVLCLPLPAAHAGSPQAVRGGGAVATGVGPVVGGGHVSSQELVTSILHDPRVIHEATQPV